MATDRIKGHLDLLLLSVVQARPAHGYEVITALRERSGGEFDLPEGTVYPLLHRLEADGLLASSWDDSGKRRRRVYRLTAPGLRALADERSSWRRYATSVEMVLGGAS